MAQESVSQQLRSVITEGRRDGGSFFGSVLAGTLLGLGLDAWLDTSPYLVIIGVLLGTYSAFARLWQEMKTQPDHPAVTLGGPGEGTDGR